MKKLFSNITFLFACVFSFFMFSGAAQAAIDVSSTTGALVTDGTSAITAVGLALITLAGIAVVFKWVKAAFF